MEFLYSLNRLNVATSRARCVCVLVGSLELFAPECQTPRQMQLANAFCRYRGVGGRKFPIRKRVSRRPAHSSPDTSKLSYWYYAGPMARLFGSQKSRNNGGRYDVERRSDS